MNSPDPQPDVDTDADTSPPANDSDVADLPMGMTASVILTSLPKDASQALKDVEVLDDRKGSCLLFLYLVFTGTIQIRRLMGNEICASDGDL